MKIAGARLAILFVRIVLFPSVSYLDSSHQTGVPESARIPRDYERIFQSKGWHNES
ncbi:MAG: hypothetical protein ACFFFC_06745 [Candidatus Thorarchaeota archaeon]